MVSNEGGGETRSNDEMHATRNNNVHLSDFNDLRFFSRGMGVISMLHRYLKKVRHKSCNEIRPENFLSRYTEEKKKKREGRIGSDLERELAGNRSKIIEQRDWKGKVERSVRIEKKNRPTVFVLLR